MHERIVIDPRICHGKPVVTGTRVPVSILIGSLAGGMTPAQVGDQYDVTDEDIRAAVAYAAELVDEEQHRLPAASS